MAKQVHQRLVRVSTFKLFALQTVERLLVMPRWINNGRLRLEQQKRNWSGNKCLTMKGGRGGRLTSSWRSRRRQVSSLETFRIPLQPRAPPPRGRTRECRTSSWSAIWSSFPFDQIRPVLASVKLSSFSPCFVSLLVWAVLFDNSCKSNLIGARSNFLQNRHKRCLCMPRTFTLFH